MNKPSGQDAAPAPAAKAVTFAVPAPVGPPPNGPQVKRYRRAELDEEEEKKGLQISDDDQE